MVSCAKTADSYADIRNNIVIVNGTQTNVNYEAIAFDSTSDTGITLDYNLYYLAPGTTGTIGESPSSVQYSTLAAWQAAITGIFTGGDAILYLLIRCLQTPLVPIRFRPTSCSQPAPPQSAQGRISG